jgi:hypothetical protein
VKLSNEAAIHVHARITVWNRATEDDIRTESERRLAGLDTTALAAVRRGTKEPVVTPQQIAAISVPVLA